MEWRKHHENNARISRWVGWGLLAAAAVYGMLDWKYGWSTRPGMAITVSGMVLTAVIILGTASAFMRKAAFFPEERRERDRELQDGSGEDPFLHRDREMMLMRQGGKGTRALIRYFSVDGELLLEFRETSRGWVFAADWILDRLRPFLPKSFVLTDRIGGPRLYLTQRGGINSPIEIRLPDGTLIGSCRQDWWKARMELRDGAGLPAGEVGSDDLLGTSFRVRDASGRELVRFYNGGLPSRNGDAFSSDADLVKVSAGLAGEPEAYVRFIAVPALIKIVFSR
ncbi:hypothetical protein PM3016_1354 [Paenibacillus mucilaginosus 3016]|uniref:Uncharacterized protein n=1 Tax=Paenibacillus mucilaginosus 3016 TaxID=1116391 RepID=H6NC87_9BACL|nr:hypothetical protein [Paenibacillus mucilaginosus]AFC28280.1 hypothetical protein PM3016_1354 [Paenibacillus mucilaginosus 3016]WFA17091.1 hypothetical protein ERY13_07045 [Paenibacillus mucilaginosus]